MTGSHMARYWPIKTCDIGGPNYLFATVVNMPVLFIVHESVVYFSRNSNQTLMMNTVFLYIYMCITLMMPL